MSRSPKVKSPKVPRRADKNGEEMLGEVIHEDENCVQDYTLVIADAVCNDSEDAALSVNSRPSKHLLLCRADSD